MSEPPKLPPSAAQQRARTLSSTTSIVHEPGASEPSLTTAAAAYAGKQGPQIYAFSRPSLFEFQTFAARAVRAGLRRDAPYASTTSIDRTVSGTLRGPPRVAAPLGPTPQAIFFRLRPLAIQRNDPRFTVAVANCRLRNFRPC